MIVELISYVAASVGILGQWLDGLTTWQGVKKFGPSIEGNKDWFAQFCVKHLSTLLYLKALIFSLAETLLVYAGPHTSQGGNFLAIVAGVAGAALGFDAAYSNYKINKGAK